MVSTPGRSGRFYGGGRTTVTRLTYDVTITGEIPELAEERKLAFMRLVDPSKGPRSLVLDTQTQWEYVEVVLAAEIAWEKFPFGPGRKVIYRGDVTFETNRDAAMREIDSESFSGGGGVTFTASAGSTVSYPLIRFPLRGDTVVQVNDFEVELNGAPDYHTAVLDYDTFSLYRSNDGIRQASLVPYMSHYERPSIMPGDSVTVSINHQATGYEDDTVTVFPNARRV